MQKTTVQDVDYPAVEEDAYSLSNGRGDERNRYARHVVKENARTKFCNFLASVLLI